MKKSKNTQTEDSSCPISSVASGFCLKTTYNLCLINHQNINYAHNDFVTTSSFEFYGRLHKIIGEFIDENFDRNNIIIAGGLISGLIEKKYDPTEYNLSDVDIFVYGESKSIIVEKIQQIYDYFVKKMNKKFYAFAYHPGCAMVNIIIPGKISIQIIGTLFKNATEVLKSFDLTCCQIGFDGHKIIFTDEFIEAIRTRITKITTKSIHAYRLVKTY